MIAVIYFNWIGKKCKNYKNLKKGTLARALFGEKKFISLILRRFFPIFPVFLYVNCFRLHPL